MLKESLLKLFKIDGLISHLTGYVETRIELLKLEIKEDLAMGMAKVIVMLGVALMFSLFILLISVAVAFKLSEHLGNFAGFSIVAGVYFVFMIILVVLRKPITTSLEKQIAERMQKKKK